MENEKVDYSKTLNLPQTDFPMRGNLPQREPEMLKFWEENDIYHQVQQNNQGKEKFILHDGPPYANGHIHLGHTLNKVLKDIIVKFKSMNGFDAPYVPGFDTHGLPIEQRAIKDLGLNRDKVSTVEFRKKCEEYAMKYVKIQSAEFQRLGVRGDWEHPYITLLPHFEAKQIKVFGEMAKRGYIYKGLKPVYWCADCETALAEAEIEYADKKSPSIYVKFAVKDSKGLFAADNTFVVIWTTTPWTIPANVAISLHPDFTYVLVEVEHGERQGEKYILAKELVAGVMDKWGIEKYKELQTFEGRDLEYVVCQHPLMDRDSLVILGEHVTLEAGTGAVHTAPGHGVDDFAVAKGYNLPVINPVDNKGRMTEEAGIFNGQDVNECNKSVVRELDNIGALLKMEWIQHQYPHCWRCKHPILFRATEQWFASIDGFRQVALDEIEKVNWVPNWGQERIHNMIADRGDWCISRQRTWGVPIPIFYCQECGQEIINDATIEHISQLFKDNGSNVWFAKEASELVPEGLTCPKCGANSFRKETDIMDVWFDSGSSHAAVLENPDDWPELTWPADLYLEGSDQHRGWFNSSLCTSVATRGQAPYKTVLTHGFIVDEQGRKMSKSLGNGVDPLDVIKQMGADILRLWVSSVDYRTDVACSTNIMKQMTEAYRKIRNTSRYLLGNLYDFDPNRHQVAYQDLTELDQWALLKLHKLIKRVIKAYDDYEFHVVYHAIHNFCTVDMSAFYLDISKDRLYTTLADSNERRAAQTVMYEIIQALVKLIAPILSYTAEEMWRYVPKAEEVISVQLTTMPEVKDEYINEKLEDKWARLLTIREAVAKDLENARQDKVIGHSLNAQVDIYTDEQLHSFLSPMAGDLAVIFIVSAVNLHRPDEDVPAGVYVTEEIPGLSIKVTQAPGEKCERCWTYSESVGQDSDHVGICAKCAAVVNKL